MRFPLETAWPEQLSSFRRCHVKIGGPGVQGGEALFRLDRCLISKSDLECKGSTVALSIKTEEADRLARALAKLTGETLTEAVTAALRERLDREEARQKAAGDLPARLAALSERLRIVYDTRPVDRAEWDAASGDEACLSSMRRQSSRSCSGSRNPVRSLPAWRPIPTESSQLPPTSKPAPSWPDGAARIGFERWMIWYILIDRRNRNRARQCEARAARLAGTDHLRSGYGSRRPAQLWRHLFICACQGA
jgi:antitoxin VapB